MRQWWTSARLQRLKWLAITFFAVAIAVLLMLQAFRQNIELYFTPSQFSSYLAGQTEGTALPRIKLGGMVKAGTVKRLTDQITTEFVVTDFASEKTVQYTGVLPDLFREGQGVVIRGEWNGQRVMADQVLAKHDEEYMPPGIEQ